jgi:hypothetical protein
MSFQLLLLVVAVLAFVGLAALRLFRVRTHRDSLDGLRQILFVFVFLFVPPVVLALVLKPQGTDAFGAIFLYLTLVALIWIVEQVLALVVARLAPVSQRQTLLMALVGRDTSSVVPFDPPMTAAMATEVKAVDDANTAFPRGTDFLAQVGRPDFQSRWQTLDAATTLLETDIAEQRRLRLGVSERALATAADARGRLDTLRRDAAPASQPSPAG